MNRSASTFLTLVLVGSAFAQSPKLSHELQNTNASGVVDVIVKYKSAPGDDPSDARHQRIIARGGVYKSTLHIIRSASYRLNATQIEELANDPEVEHISLDHPLSAVSSTATPTAPSSISIDYFRETVNLDDVNSAGWNGSGLGIALIDSGITPNEDLYQAMTYSQSFVSGDSSTADAYGHGTHVAGILAGSGSNSSSNSKYKFGGGAPGTYLINLRVLDANGNGTDSGVISAIQKAIQLKTQYNIRIINLSLGRPVAESYVNDPLCQAVEAAWHNGIAVIVAAGNEGRNNSAGTNGYATILAPGNDPYVITVGAMNSMGTSTRNDDIITSYSSKGPTLIDHVVKPDLVAPGNLVISVEVPGSTLANTYPQNDVPTSVYSNSGSQNKAHKYFVLSGTSMATPVVASAAAIVLQKFPSLTPDLLKARLMKSASKTFPVSSAIFDPATGITYTDYYDIFTVGAGYLDAAAALTNQDTGSGSAVSPAAAYSASTKTATLSIGGSSVIWGSNGLWGTNVIWGTNVLVSGSNVIWGTNVIWGATSVNALNVIWGSTTAAAQNVIWGSSTDGAQYADSPQ